MLHTQKAFILFFLCLCFCISALAGNVYYNSKGELIKHEQKKNAVSKKGTNYYIIGQSGKLYKLSKQGLEVLNGKHGPFTELVEDWQTNHFEDGLIARTGAAISGYHEGKESVLAYILKESRDIPGCMMNQKVNLSKTKLYVFNNCAYNANEAGNVIWGAAMNVFGFRPALTWCCSHGGTFLLKHRLDEQYEALAAYKGSRYLKKASKGSVRSEIIELYAGSYNTSKSYHLTSLIGTLTSF